FGSPLGRCRRSPECRRLSVEICIIFFFQAEDGIRDRNVTGVQTCALPISVIITEQMANALNVKEGDEIVLKSGEESEKTVTVGNITENYMMHYVYMTKDLYKQLYEEEPSYDMMLIDLAKDQIENEEAIGKAILDQPAAYAMTYVSTNRETIEQMLGSLNIVIVVLIISAGLLAFVVLYNLNNINITERR